MPDAGAGRRCHDAHSIAGVDEMADPPDQQFDRNAEPKSSRGGSLMDQTLDVSKTLGVSNAQPAIGTGLIASSRRCRRTYTAKSECAYRTPGHQAGCGAGGQA